MHTRRKSEKELKKFFDLEKEGLKLKEGFFSDDKLINPKFLEPNVGQRGRKAIVCLEKYYLNNFDLKKYVCIFVTH